MTWSGSFTNERFPGPGTYQTKNGVRVFLDMATVPGPVTVLAIAPPEAASSFIIEWDNPNRELITLTSPDEYESVFSIFRNLIPSVSTRLCRGLVGFTFVEDHWEVFTFFQFGVRLHDVAFVGWRGRSTNGLATLLAGSFGVIDVERTSVGIYVVRLTPGLIISGETLVMPTVSVTGLAANDTGDLRTKDPGIATADEIVMTGGSFNMGGVFQPDDLDGVATNFMAIKVQQFP